MDISNNDFLNGNYKFIQANSGANITLQSGAQITTANGGQVWLLAKNIEQAGSISTPSGQTILAAGTQVQVADSALGNMIFTVTTDGTNNIQNLGAIASLRGAAGLFADNITHQGTIEANNGQVIANADNNLTIQNNATISTNSTDGTNAGKINLSAGNKLEIQTTAQVSADGDAMGGNGGEIALTANDLRVSPVANGIGNVRAIARHPNAINGTVTFNQTANYNYQPSGEFIITQADKSQYNPTTTVLADGGFVVTWRSNQKGNYDIYGQRYDAAGKAVGAEFVISNAANNLYFPAIAALADGGFIVIWYTQPSGNGDIYGRRYNASGDAAGAEFAINNAPGNQHHPAIATLKDGSFVVTWRSENNTTDDIYGQHYNASGAAISAPFVISNVASDDSTPAIAPLAEGGFVVTWQNKNSSTSWDIYARRYDGSGSPLGAEFVISDVKNAQYEPAIASLKDGGFAVTWRSYQSGGTYNISGRRYNSSGTPSGAEFVIGNGVTDDRTQAIAALADGGFLTTWQKGQSSNYDIYARRYDASGAAVGDEFVISSAANSQHEPAIAALADGGFVATWRSFQNGSSPDIYGQRYAKVSATFTPDNQLTANLESVPRFNTRPGLINGVYSPPPIIDNSIDTSSTNPSIDNSSTNPSIDISSTNPSIDISSTSPSIDTSSTNLSIDTSSTKPSIDISSTITNLPSLSQSIEVERELSRSYAAYQPSDEIRRGADAKQSASQQTITASWANSCVQKRQRLDDTSDAIASPPQARSQTCLQEQAYEQMVGAEQYALTQGMSWKARQAYWNEQQKKQALLTQSEYAAYLNQLRSMSSEERIRHYESLAKPTDSITPAP